MTRRYPEIAFTPSVRAVQDAHGARKSAQRLLDMEWEDQRLGEDEAAFIGARDSFYMATANDDGWPYVQHRGGPTGFVRVLDDKTLAFANYRGNRQYVSAGNVVEDDRVSLFFVDYPHQRRLKIFARARFARPEEVPDLAEKVRDPNYSGKVEHIVVLNVEAFDWNCPQHITPRWTAHELEAQLEPVKQRLAALETENARLRDLVPSG
ncbi:MAG: pyridoxamine 5'-phosphate oxidase family protein [Myxococcota bacterium]